MVDHQQISPNYEFIGVIKRYKLLANRALSFYLNKYIILANIAIHEGSD